MGRADYFQITICRYSWYPFSIWNYQFYSSSAYDPSFLYSSWFVVLVSAIQTQSGSDSRCSLSNYSFLWEEMISNLSGQLFAMISLKIPASFLISSSFLGFDLEIHWFFIIHHLVSISLYLMGFVNSFVCLYRFVDEKC